MTATLNALSGSSSSLQECVCRKAVQKGCSTSSTGTGTPTGTGYCVVVKGLNTLCSVFRVISVICIFPQGKTLWPDFSGLGSLTTEYFSLLYRWAYLEF